MFKRILLTLGPLIAIVGCSDIISRSDDEVVEKNIEAYLESRFPDLKIVSSEYSRMFISRPLDETKIPAGFGSAAEEAMACVCWIMNDTFTPITKNAIDDLIRDDKRFKEWGTGAANYIKFGFFEVEYEGVNVENIGISFSIDSLLNVKTSRVIKEDCNYAYYKVFTNN